VGEPEGEVAVCGEDGGRHEYAAFISAQSSDSASVLVMSPWNRLRRASICNAF
jgi:hypothetical protein